MLSELQTLDVSAQTKNMKLHETKRKPPPFTIDQILAWADSYHERTGKWPMSETKDAKNLPLGENWRKVSNALSIGLRGLPGGSSLARLLDEKRGVRNIANLPDLTIQQILSWADLHYQRHGKWPNEDSGPVKDASGEGWQCIDQALREGGRGLPGGDTLPRILEKHRGVPNRLNLPRLTIKKILAWADAHHRRTGKWPKNKSGSVTDYLEETWHGIDEALRKGGRGLPGGSSLARLLARRRGVRNEGDLPQLTEAKILDWADAHQLRTGSWPRPSSGPIVGTDGETWKAVELALIFGLRGLPGDSSLVRLLAERRGAPSKKRTAILTVEQILAWADEHYAKTGKWPTAKSGPVIDEDNEIWRSIEAALRLGHRGLPGGSSIAKLLAAERGRCNRKGRPRLTVKQVLGWAEKHHERTGKWPSAQSGPIPEAPGETWRGVEMALVQGNRGFLGGSSIYRLLEASGAKNRVHG